MSAGGEVFCDPRGGGGNGQVSCRRRDVHLAQIALSRASSGMISASRLVRSEAARPVFDVGFAPRRVEIFADFVAAFRFGVNVDFLAGPRFFATLVRARVLAVDDFALVLRLVG